MLPYFPIAGAADAPTMDARALVPDRLSEVDAHYRAELALKEALLAADRRYRYRAPAGTEAMQWEALELLLPNVARHHPAHFTLHTAPGHWCWTNRLLDTRTAFTLGDPASLPLPPLDWLGRQLQEDLLLLDGAVAGTPLVAGHLCFPAGWCLDDKIGQPFLAIHGPVPGFAERVGRPAGLLLQRLKPGRPAGRVGWGIVADGDLDHAPATAARRRHAARGITSADAGGRCFLRLERQTFSRLPRTGAILFTIHTYRAPLAAVIAEEPARARHLAAALSAMPPALRDYKGLTPFADALLAYLDARAAETSTTEPDPARATR